MPNLTIYVPDDLYQKIVKNKRASTLIQLALRHYFDAKDGYALDRKKMQI